MKTENVVIKAVTKEDGPRIIEYFKSIGVNTIGYEGSCCEVLGSTSIYYGVINGVFQNWSIQYVQKHNATIIGLPMSDKVTWTREQFISLHDMACPTWKLNLAEMFPRFAFQDVCEITEEQYTTMYKACTRHQARLMNQIFGKEPFKKKVMFMCTRTFDDVFTKDRTYELIENRDNGYVLLNNYKKRYTVTVGHWADYFHRID